MFDAIRDFELKILHVLTCDLESPISDGSALIR